MESKYFETKLENVLKNTWKSVQHKRIHNLILKFVAIRSDSFEYFWTFSSINLKVNVTFSGHCHKTFLIVITILCNKLECLSIVNIYSLI
jgi:hypothetical protein